MNTNMTELFQKSVRPRAMDESSLSIGRVNGIILPIIPGYSL